MTAPTPAVDAEELDRLEADRALVLSHFPTPWVSGQPHPSGWLVSGKVKGYGRSHIADMRGWGFLTSKSCRGLTGAEATAVQEAAARLIAASVNAAARASATPPQAVSAEVREADVGVLREAADVLDMVDHQSIQEDASSLSELRALNGDGVAIIAKRLRALAALHPPADAPTSAGAEGLRERVMAGLRRRFDAHPMVDASQAQLREIRLGWLADDVCAALSTPPARSASDAVGELPEPIYDKHLGWDVDVAPTPPAQASAALSTPAPDTGEELVERLRRKTDYTDRTFENRSLGDLYREAAAALQRQTPEPGSREDGGA